MGTKLILSCTLLLLAMPVRAQWSGRLDLAGGYGMMPHGEEAIAEHLNHGLMQMNAALHYRNPQWTWNTTLDGRWEPKSSDSYRADAKSDISVVMKDMTTRPLSAGLRSDLAWTPAADRKYESWISYRYNHDDGHNQTSRLVVSPEDVSSGTASIYYEEPHKYEHVLSAGLRTSHQLGVTWRELSSSLGLDATMNRQNNEWAVLDPTEFTSETIDNADHFQSAIWSYRITPRRTNLKLSGQVHFQDSVLRGSTRMVLDPGIRITSQHDMDQNSGATLDMDDSTGQEVWKDSLRLRENFNFLTFQAEPYLAGDFSWKSIRVRFDYALQLYARRLNDNDHTQRISLHGVYPVGNGSISWQPSGRHRLSINNRLSVSHPNYYQICWYERTGGYLDQLYRGNDNLRSTVTRLYSLEYEFNLGIFSSNTTLSMTRRKNETDQTWSDEEIDGRRYKVFTWINSADSWSFGAMERLGWDGKFVTAHLGVGYNQTLRIARETGAVKKSFDWNLTADASTDMGRGWTVKTDVRYQSKVATFFAMFSEYCVLNARIQKRFPSVTVYLEGRDLLDSRRESSFISSNMAENWVESVRNNRRLVVLGLIWDIR